MLDGCVNECADSLGGVQVGRMGTAGDKIQRRMRQGAGEVPGLLWVYHRIGFAMDHQGGGEVAEINAAATKFSQGSQPFVPSVKVVGKAQLGANFVVKSVTAQQEILKGVDGLFRLTT